MEQYSGFARVYDMFMDNVPYDKWAKYVHSLLRANGVKISKKQGAEAPLVCELGCGTGNMTRRFRDLGYDMIGIDISQEMLQIAREKEAEGDDSILYLCQDMCDFELYGTVAAVVSLCDSLNYVTDIEDLRKVFKLVNNYLDPGGVFVFDIHTPYYYSKVLGEQTICENREEGSFIWENFYDPETKINEFDMTIYYDASRKGTFTRCEETHYQRAYSLNEITKALDKAGMDTVGMYDEITHEVPSKTSERVYMVARTRK